MNGPTTGKTTPLERGNKQGNPEPGNAAETAAGEGGPPRKPGLCNGNHLAAAETQARPGCLEKLPSSLTPSMKKEGSVSSV